jgi:hypothetical protein
MRKAILEHNWLPTRQGALIKILPVHQNNKLYETDIRIFVLEAPFLRPKSNKIARMYSEPRYTQLEANLRWFKDRYEEILRKRPDDWQEEAPEGSYRDFRRRYYEYIEDQLADVDRKIIGVSKPDR